jgi:hypothetical protein
MSSQTEKTAKPVAKPIDNPTYADAILDRLVHNAHRIELTGESGVPVVRARDPLPKLPKHEALSPVRFRVRPDEAAAGLRKALDAMGESVPRRVLGRPPRV